MYPYQCSVEDTGNDCVDLTPEEEESELIPVDFDQPANIEGTGFQLNRVSFEDDTIQRLDDDRCHLIDTAKEFTETSDQYVNIIQRYFMVNYAKHLGNLVGIEIPDFELFGDVCSYLYWANKNKILDKLKFEVTQEVLTYC